MFAREREMTPIVTAWMREQGLLVRPERILWSLCDLVGCALNRERVERRRRHQKDWRPLHDRIIAVELKLSRIGEAFSQAEANRCWVEETWVAFPMDVARRVIASGHRWNVASGGIGVLGVEVAGCEVLMAARPTGADDEHIEHQVEKFFRERRKLGFEG